MAGGEQTIGVLGPGSLVEQLGAHRERRGRARRGRRRAAERHHEAPGGCGDDDVRRVGALDRTVEDVVALDECRDEPGARELEDLFRLAYLLDPGVVHHHHPIAEREGLVLVVGHPHERDARATLHVLELEHHGARPGNERARQRHPLLLSARQRVGLARAEPGDLEGVQDLGHPPTDLLPGSSEHLEPEADLAGDRHVREQREVLEHHRDVPPPWRHLVDPDAGDPDLTRVGLLEPRDQPECRRLAAPGRAQQAHELALLDDERDLVDGHEAAESLRDPTQLEVVHGRGHGRRRSD